MVYFVLEEEDNHFFLLFFSLWNNEKRRKQQGKYYLSGCFIKLASDAKYWAQVASLIGQHASVPSTSIGVK